MKSSELLPSAEYDPGSHRVHPTDPANQTYNDYAKSTRPGLGEILIKRVFHTFKCSKHVAGITLERIIF
jgi:hypothetical protein